MILFGVCGRWLLLKLGVVIISNLLLNRCF